MHQTSARIQAHPVPACRQDYPRAKRPYLVFVRAGNESWHQRLLQENPDRNWDCCVNWYVEPLDESDADYYFTAPQTINKLQGFLEFRKQFGDNWPYRYVLLLDDDLYLRPFELDHFFDICEIHQTYLSQPAQRWFTHTTLNSLVRNPVCILRRVSFVEGMAPCFSAAALAELIHTFDWTKSIWGTDWAWGCLLQDREAIHVVDAVALYHTRTGSGRKTRFYQQLLAMGVEPGEELRGIQRRFPRFPGPRKWEAEQGRMAAAVAGFSLTKTNISTPILSPALSAEDTQFVMNGARNYGLEADFRGAIGPALQVLASYAYTHSSVDGFSAIGIPNVPPKNYELLGNGSLYGVPRNGGSLWTSYHLDSGLKLGLGVIARGARYGDNANDYRLPAFFKVGALGAYGWRAWDTHFEVQLNVDNLFDKHYFESLNGTRTVLPGMPRRFIATLRASF